MDYLQLIVLAVIQGITEFLPISSSAHLILPKEVLGWPDQGLAFDVAVHVGSLAAVLIYFWRDIWQVAEGWTSSLVTRKQTDSSRLGWYIIWATIPAGLCGFVFNDFIEENFRTTVVIMITTVVFGLFLAWADKQGSKVFELSDMTLRIALIIGLSQALALIPGTSRSGITISMALALGMQRESAARFSFLLSIPLIAAGGGLKSLELLDATDTNWNDIIIGTVLSGMSAYLCISLFLGFINRIGMMPFVVYRLCLGAVLAMLLFVG
ncbi:MAG: undecaprenyl-diphosphate phosphatase [Cellvibrionaceae bacterium]